MEVDADADALSPPPPPPCSLRKTEDEAPGRGVPEDAPPISKWNEFHAWFSSNGCEAFIVTSIITVKKEVSERDVVRIKKRKREKEREKEGGRHNNI